MNLEPGERLKLGNVSRVRVRNLSREKDGSFSLNGSNIILGPTEIAIENLLVNNDMLINSGKTILEITVM